MRGRKAVSLTYEIDHVADALEGGRILARAFIDQQLSNDYDHRRVPVSLLALLGTTVERLRLIAAVLRRETPAIRLWSQANDTTPRPVHDEDYDVRLLCDPEPSFVPPPPGRAPRAGRPAPKRHPARERRSDSDPKSKAVHQKLPVGREWLRRASRAEVEQGDIEDPVQLSLDAPVTSADAEKIHSRLGRRLCIHSVIRPS